MENIFFYQHQHYCIYYSSPIILIFVDEKNYINKLFSRANSINGKNLIFKLIFQPLFFLQILIFSLITIISGYQTLYGIINYESYMNNYAYNYNTSKILNNYADEPILYLEGGITPLLFLNKDYIHADKYKKCLTSKKNDYSNSLFYLWKCYCIEI